MIQFGDQNNPGITWTASVNAPDPGAGLIAFTQLVSADRHQTLTDGTKKKLTSNGDYVLDNALGIQYRRSVPDNQLLQEYDYPNVGTAGMKELSANDSFHLYLMYKPAGDDSIWVTLRLLDWYWNFSAHLVGSNWVVDSSSYPTQPLVVNSIELPQWLGFVTSIGWVNE
jgi:hypothetical protein